jgi:hypothetical protein
VVAVFAIQVTINELHPLTIGGKECTNVAATIGSAPFSEVKSSFVHQDLEGNSVLKQKK